MQSISIKTIIILLMNDESPLLYPKSYSNLVNKSKPAQNSCHIYNLFFIEHGMTQSYVYKPNNFFLHFLHTTLPIRTLARANGLHVDISTQ